MDKNENNVVLFPGLARTTPPNTIEEVMRSVTEVRREHVEMLIDEALSFVFSRVGEEGFDLAREECTKTTALLIESLRAALLHTVGINHPLQSFAESSFTVVSEDSAVRYVTANSSFCDQDVEEAPV